MREVRGLKGSAGGPAEGGRDVEPAAGAMGLIPSWPPEEKCESLSGLKRPSVTVKCSESFLSSALGGRCVLPSPPIGTRREAFHFGLVQLRRKIKK